MAVQNSHEKLRAAYPNRWDADTDRLAKDELKAMLAEFGQTRTDSAVIAFVRAEQFFSVAKLREYIPPAEGAKHRYDPNCPLCMDGWREVTWKDFSPTVKNRLITLYGFQAAQLEKLVDRCTCWGR